MRLALSECGDARPKLGRGAPAAVLILLDDVGHVNDMSHNVEYGMSRLVRGCLGMSEDIGGVTRRG